MKTDEVRKKSCISGLQGNHFSQCTRRKKNFLEFPLPFSSGSFMPETNTSKDAFFQNIFLEEDFLGNRDSEMKKKSVKKCVLHGSRPGKCARAKKLLFWYDVMKHWWTCPSNAHRLSEIVTKESDTRVSYLLDHNHIFPVFFSPRSLFFSQFFRQREVDHFQPTFK